MTLQIVPGHVRDPARCQALVLSSVGKGKGEGGRQCSAKATSKRRPDYPPAARKGEEHPVCRLHKLARWFVLWRPVDALRGAEAIEHRRRVIDRLPLPLPLKRRPALWGPRPVKP